MFKRIPSSGRRDASRDRMFLTEAADAVRAKQFIKAARREGKVLYHSGDRSLARIIHNEGLQPLFGPWVTEVLHGATDDPELLAEIKSQPPATFLDAKPQWVVAKVGNKLRKPYRHITMEDVQAHGHLAIFVIRSDDEGVLRVTDTDYGKYESVPGKVKYRGWWEVPYQHAEQAPFGLEPGDYFSMDPLEPAVTLVGDALVAFLGRRV